MKCKVIRACIDQDTKKRLEPGDIWQPASDFELGRHLAEANVVPVDDTVIERAVTAPPETRPKRRTRRKKANGV